MSDKFKDANHPLYAKATPETADGVAWVFYDKDTFDKYYYTLPELGPTDVRIKTLYAGLCHSDVMTGREHWGPQLRPVCTGHEVVGEVTAIGPNVKHVKVGEQVMFGPFRDSCGKCEYCNEGETGLCLKTESQDKLLYGLYFGGYASVQQHPESHCYKIPHGLNVKNAAPLMCAGVTVFAPMHRHLKKGNHIAVLGVGGLGHLAVQYGVKMGMTVDAFMSGTKSDKLDYVKSLGTSDIIFWKEQGKLDKYANTYDAILFTAPIAPTREEFDRLIVSLKPRGKLIILGAPDVKEQISLSFFPLIMGEKSVIGSVVGGRKSTEEMLNFSAHHNVECLCEHFLWEDFPKALERIEKGAPKFRCVVDYTGVPELNVSQKK